MRNPKRRSTAAGTVAPDPPYAEQSGPTEPCDSSTVAGILRHPPRRCLSVYEATTTKKKPNKAKVPRTRKTRAKSTVRFAQMRRQLADIGGCSEQAVTGDTIPEPFHRLWRSFTPDERMYVWLGAVANVHQAAEERRRVMESFPEYLTRLPDVIPEGRVLMHNRVQPTARLRSRGFRAWLSAPDPQGLEACDCGWAPKLGRHFRVIGIPRANWKGEQTDCRIP